MNLYAYSRNDPMNLSDPTGMCTASRIDTASGSICAGSGSITIPVGGSAPEPLNQRAARVTVVVRLPNHRHGSEADSARSFFEENEDEYQQTRTTDRELLGAAVRMPDGSYRHTTAATVPSRFTGRLRITNMPRGARITAQLHSHPAGGERVFSGDDIKYVRETGTRSYLRTPSGRLRLLTSAAARRADDDRTEGANACPVTPRGQEEQCVGQ